MLELADAESDEDKEDAVKEACEQLVDVQAELEVRVAAAIALGRMRAAAPQAIGELGGALSGTAHPAKLRAASAWALGEMRSEASLSALASALRAQMDG